MEVLIERVGVRSAIEMVVPVAAFEFVPASAAKDEIVAIAKDDAAVMAAHKSIAANPIKVL